MVSYVIKVVSSRQLPLHRLSDGNSRCLSRVRREVEGYSHPWVCDSMRPELAVRRSALRRSGEPPSSSAAAGPGLSSSVPSVRWRPVSLPSKT